MCLKEINSDVYGENYVYANFYGFGVLMAVVKGDKNGLSAKCEGMARANAFLKSKQYSELPLICKQV